MREVGFRFQRFRYCSVLTELTAIIERDGVANIFIATQHRDNGTADFPRLFGEHLFSQIDTALTFGQRHDSARTLGTQHKVCFPVTQAATLINHRRALLDRYRVGYTPALCSVALAVTAFTLSQMLI